MTFAAMSPPAVNDNDPPGVRWVPLIGEIHDDGSLVRYLRPPLVPFPNDPREA